MTPSRFSTRRLRRVALVAIGGLLLNAATVHFANAAALLRGVPTGEICDVWGVRLPDAPAPMHHAMLDESMSMSDARTTSADAHERDMAAMAMPGDDTSMAMAMGDDPSGTAAADATPTPPAHDHASHAHHQHDACEHCVLAGLTTFASSVPVLAAAPAPERAPILARTSASAAPVFDAVASWRLQLKHGPPRPA